MPFIATACKLQSGQLHEHSADLHSVTERTGHPSYENVQLANTGLRSLHQQFLQRAKLCGLFFQAGGAVEGIARGADGM